MSRGKLLEIARRVKKVGAEVMKNLGCGFNETVFQNALAIEFRKNGIEYLQEVNIEIFYKGEHVGVDRPDFVITKAGDFKKPVILEMKIADRVSDGHRMQLKSYCTSFPRNNNPVLKDFAGGLLMSFPTHDAGAGAGIKIVVVDAKFNIILDEQEEEEERIAREKESERKKKVLEKQKEEKKKK